MRFRTFGYICFGLVFTVATASAVPVRYPSCAKPDASFKAFLQHFTNDTVFQRSRLSLPLVVRAGDGVTVSSTVELWDLKHIKELKDPLIYSDVQRQKANISLSVDLVHESPAVAEVWQAEKSEGDAVKLQYWFHKRDGCWFLAEFDDWSE